MDFLGMGPMEIMVVLLIALAVFGPERMVDIARKLGQIVRHISKVGSEVTRTLSEENLPKQEKQMVKDIKKIGSDVQQTLSDSMRPVEEAGRHINQTPPASAPVTSDTNKDLSELGPPRVVPPGTGAVAPQAQKGPAESKPQ